MSSAKAEHELGYAVRPFEEMARDTLRWWASRGKLPVTTPALRAIVAEVEAEERRRTEADAAAPPPLARGAAGPRPAPHPAPRARAVRANGVLAR